MAINIKKVSEPLIISILGQSEVLRAEQSPLLEAIRRGLLVSWLCPQQRPLSPHLLLSETTTLISSFLEEDCVLWPTMILHRRSQLPARNESMWIQGSTGPTKRMAGLEPRNRLPKLIKPRRRLLSAVDSPILSTKLPHRTTS